MKSSDETNDIKAGSFIKFMLICGILAQLFWIGADIIASIMYKNYSFLHQAISELTAIGSPVKSLLMVTNNYIFTPLYLAFGIGILLLAKQLRILKTIAIFIFIQFFLSLISILFPINARGNEMGLNGIMHSIIYILIPVIYMLIIGFGSKVFGKRFLIYSIVTLVLVVIGFVLTGIAVPKIVAGTDTPWLGVYERVNAYGSMVWLIVFAILLLNKTKKFG